MFVGAGRKSILHENICIKLNLIYIKKCLKMVNCFNKEMTKQRIGTKML